MGKEIVTIVETNYLRTLEIAKEYKNIELRLDKLNFSAKQVEQIINASEKIIITNALQSNNPFIFNLITNQNVIVDIPFDFLFDGNNNLDVFADCQVLVSYHYDGSFAKLFDTKIHSMIKKMLTVSDILEVSYLKIAVTINDTQEEEKFFSLFEKYPELKEKLILVPLGKKFQYSRIKSLELGSPFMYCYVDKPATECQLSYEQLTSRSHNAD